MVYDFVKLKGWKEARYGRQKVEAFVRHVSGPDQISITRLRPEYRYRLLDLPN